MESEQFHLLHKADFKIECVIFYCGHTQEKMMGNILNLAGNVYNDESITTMVLHSDTP